VFALTHISCVKLEFHGTDTDTDTDTDILADLSADLSDTRDLSVRNARVYTCKRVKRVLYTTSYRVHVYKITQ